MSLYVLINEAQGLRKQDPNALIQANINVSLSDSDQNYLFRLEEPTLAPKWFEHCDFKVENPIGKTITIRLLDGDADFAIVKIPITEDSLSSTLPHWYKMDLVNPENGGNPEIKASIKFEGKELQFSESEKQSEQMQAIDTASGVETDKDSESEKDESAQDSEKESTEKETETETQHDNSEEEDDDDDDNNNTNAEEDDDDEKDTDQLTNENETTTAEGQKSETENETTEDGKAAEEEEDDDDDATDSQAANQNETEKSEEKQEEDDDDVEERHSTTSSQPLSPRTNVVSRSEETTRLQLNRSRRIAENLNKGKENTINYEKIEEEATEKANDTYQNFLRQVASVLFENQKIIQSYGDDKNEKGTEEEEEEESVNQQSEDMEK